MSEADAQSNAAVETVITKIARIVGWFPRWVDGRGAIRPARLFALAFTHLTQNGRRVLIQDLKSS
jgi:hypothetical protein